MMNVMFRRLAAAAFVGAVLAGCTQESDAAQRTFVLWDPGLQLPAVCYRLDDGWQGKGAIAWNMRSDNKFTLALGILSLRGAYASKWNYIMAASLVMVVPAVILFAVGQRYFIEGIVLTGVKG